jgi:hypothetical protein
MDRQTAHVSNGSCSEHLSPKAMVRALSREAGGYVGIGSIRVPEPVTGGLPMTVYDPDIPKTDEEIALEAIIRDLVERLYVAREDSAEQRFIERQLDGIRHGSELGGLLMEEYDMGGISAVRHW